MAAEIGHSAPGGIIYTYCAYNSRQFPMPAAAPPDMVSPAFNHLMAYGTMEGLTEEQLAEAVEIDPSQIKGLGPSLQSLLALLKARKDKILSTYETQIVLQRAERVFRDAAREARPGKRQQRRFLRAVRDEQIVDLERLWYSLDQHSVFARQLVGIMDHLGNKYQIEELISKYDFTGAREMSIEKALQIKEELEAIDRLIEQLQQAAKDAKVYLIDMEQLAHFVEQEQMEDLEHVRDQVAELLQQLAEQQGLKRDAQQYHLTPKAMKLFQDKLLDQIFSDLEAARTGRHDVAISGEGSVELQRTKPYEFGDSLANMDATGSMINSLVRHGPGLPVRMEPRDIEIHLTRNTPKCATVVCMDMSGSMRYDGQYINVKRMALALHGLIRTEYPGDFLDFVEIHTLPRRRHISVVPELLPKPVTIYDSLVRLKVDMSSDRITEFDIPPHFTNLQHGLALARRLLQVQDTPNRQIILITDGLPTAHFEENWLYLLYPPHPRTEHCTMREGILCREQGIVINVFLLSNWSQTREDIQFSYNLAERTSGRVFFAGGKDLDRFVVWDYLHQRRLIIA